MIEENDGFFGDVLWSSDEASPIDDNISSDEALPFNNLVSLYCCFC
jgi:hypothetical protein